MVKLEAKKIGETFRQLRKEEKYKGPDLVAGITSISSLNKFEKGDLNLSFAKVIMLLDRLHISADEFIQLIEPDFGRSYQDLINKIYQDYVHKDIRSLREALDDVAKRYQNEESNFGILIQAVVVALIKDLDPNFVVEPEINNQLFDYLMAVENWGNFQISIFNNCLTILSSQMIHSIMKELAFKISKMAHVHDNQEYALTAIVNAVEVLLNRNDLAGAQQLVRFFENAQLSQEASVIRIKLAFFKNLLSKNSDALQDNSSLIHTLRVIGSKQLASSYEEYQEKFLQEHPF
ncbi:hypothetical protein NRF22_04340 [Oenococcus kitaharae]|uniref:helix-turn-helix domain-containing protein n=1 Tax=Oenococcus TaxID=46254 RepID=UPI0021E7AF64|nr:Rgg/GadR/MutR family transcriptional regulator [Oenococcus kitaharae]MCV3296342.1 hypothetical protein [Oenococcus kitaharae]